MFNKIEHKEHRKTIDMIVLTNIDIISLVTAYPIIFKMDVLPIHTASICNNWQAIDKSHFPWLYTKMWGRLDTV